ncbi:MAG: tetratricopeptide repeat protein [Bacteroidetes bacterium]|nr:tetratricopeptide repeat protein [Bacteroidota bacterium]
MPSAPLFSTPQWIAICISAMILSAVLTATFLPTPQSDAADRATTQNAATPQPKVDLQRLESMRAYIANHPEDLDAKLRYANDLHDAKLLDQAIAQYKEYLLQVPDNPDARVDLGICYFELQQYDAAIQEMERAVSDHPDHQLGRYNLGIVNLNAGNRDAAQSWFTTARDLDPSSPYGTSATQILQSEFGVQK